MGFFHTLHSLDNWALLILRIALAASFLIHGLEKWKMWKMKPSEQLPAPLIINFRILSIAEPVGAIALLFGFFTQIAAIGFAIIMIGAIDHKARRRQKKFGEPGGWELDAIILAAVLVLMTIGAGAISVDRILLGI